LFTGIIEEVGVIGAHVDGELKVRCVRVLDGTEIGDSVAVNGVCLTVTKLSSDGFEADVSAETAALTTLGRLRPGSPVNLERAARLGRPMGGHLVQGHVDGTGTIMETSGGGLRVKADPETVLDYCVVKGSIAVDGVSLTIAGLDAGSFRVALIPHTLENTNLGNARPGDEVNLEVDIIAKYVKKFIGGEATDINEAFLAEHGYI
jgi:riboflavin synthase